jgi:hypothetical protein
LSLGLLALKGVVTAATGGTGAVALGVACSAAQGLGLFDVMPVATEGGD